MPLQLSFFKKCSHCQKVKFFFEFHKNRSTPTGLQHLCKDCERESWNQWAARHPEVVKEQTKRKYPTHRAYIEAHKDEYREYATRYHRENKAKWIASRQKRRAAIKESGGSFTDQEWKELCDRYGNVCLCCKQKLPLVPDHVIPLSKGGSGGIENIQPLCQPCNRRKWAQETDYRL